MAANHAQPVSPHPFGFCTSHWSTGKCQKDTCKDFAHVTHEEAEAHSPDWLKNELWTNCKLPAVQLQRQLSVETHSSAWWRLRVSSYELMLVSQALSQGMTLHKENIKDSYGKPHKRLGRREFPLLYGQERTHASMQRLGLAAHQANARRSIRDAYSLFEQFVKRLIEEILASKDSSVRVKLLSLQNRPEAQKSISIADVMRAGSYEALIHQLGETLLRPLLMEQSAQTMLRGLCTTLAQAEYNNQASVLRKSVEAVLPFIQLRHLLTHEAGMAKNNLANAQEFISVCGDKFQVQDPDELKKMLQVNELQPGNDLLQVPLLTLKQAAQKYNAATHPRFSVFIPDAAVLEALSAYEHLAHELDHLCTKHMLIVPVKFDKSFVEGLTMITLP